MSSDSLYNNHQPNDDDEDNNSDGELGLEYHANILEETSNAYRFTFLFQELMLNPSNDVNQAISRSKKWMKLSSDARTRAREAQIIGDDGMETRRTAARVFLIVLELLKFSKIDELCIEQAVRLVQRWNVILELFSNPSITIRIFTLRSNTCNELQDLLIPLMKSLMGFDTPQPSVNEILSKCERDGINDTILEDLGRTLFYDCLATEHRSGLDFEMIRSFHLKLIELVEFISDVKRREEMMAREHSIEAIDLGSLSPSTLQVVFNKEGMLNGISVINERITILMQTLRKIDNNLNENTLKNLPLEYTHGHMDQARLNANRSGHERQMRSLRNHLSSHFQRGTFSRSITEDVEQYNMELQEKGQLEENQPWYEIHPILHPIGLRLIFILLSFDVYENTFDMVSTSSILQWCDKLSYRSREVVSNWLTTHVPIKTIHDQMTVCQSLITTKGMQANLSPLLNESNFKNKLLKDYGVSDQWVDCIRSAMQYLQFLANVNHQREIMCEVSPENPMIIFGYNKGAASRAAVVLNRPLVFDREDNILPDETVRILFEKRKQKSLLDQSQLPVRVIDGYLHHQAFYNPILNQKPKRTHQTLPMGQRPTITDEFSPLLRYEFIRWISTNSQLELELMHKPALFDSSNKYKMLQFFSTVAQTEQAERNSEPRQTIFGFLATYNPYWVVEVRRDHLLKDALRTLDNANPSHLRKNMKVTFVGEEGIDEGGVCKEFFQLLIEELFNPMYGMFLKNSDNTLWLFNPMMKGIDDLCNFVLVGLIFGLALYNGILLDVKFPQSVFKMLLDIEVTMQDLAQIDLDVARSLWSIVEMTEDEFKTLGLTWSATTNLYDETLEVPISNYHKIDEIVTYEQRHQYVDAYVKWRCEKSIEKPFQGFKKGFYKVLSKSLLAPLDLHPEELEDLIIGCQTLIDTQILKDTCQYAEGYDAKSQTIVDFWAICEELNQNDLKQLLWFITGSDRLPVGGAQDVKLTIFRAGPNSELLPSAHTCFNYLLIPDYKNREKLRKKLHIAINNAQGFGLR